jgi:DNA-binding transcriptional LysR family regulator
MQVAASELNTSRSSITKIVKKLEATAGENLFARNANKLTPTTKGLILAAAANRALGWLEAAEAEICGAANGANFKRRFIHVITNSQFRALLAVISHGSHTAAAAQLQVSQPAVTMALRDLQNAVGGALLEKTADGIVANSSGRILAEAARSAFSHLEELDPLFKPAIAKRRQRVVLGVLPLAGALVPARAVESFLRNFPDADLALVEGPYASLLRGLRAGDIDLIIGGLSSPATEPDIAHQQLYVDELMAAVRPSHPLAGNTVVSLGQLWDYRWVVPRTNTPARIALERLLQDHNLPMPPNFVETNSILAMRSLLIEGDMIAFITRGQVQVDQRSGVLSTMGLDVPRSLVPVGVRLRAGCRPNETLRGFLRHLERSGSAYLTAVS